MRKPAIQGSSLTLAYIEVIDNHKIKAFADIVIIIIFWPSDPEITLITGITIYQYK
jgi:hypothetical protein